MLEMNPLLREPALRNLTILELCTQIDLTYPQDPLLQEVIRRLRQPRRRLQRKE